MELPRNKEAIEKEYSSILAPFATHQPKDSSREYSEEPCDEENRSSFQRDRDRIIHSTAFRRLMYKTQVFVNHEGDHFRTRLTHTLEVAQFARGICKSLALNEDLAEAIALGHDLGHTPFGHAVERYLDEELDRREMGHFFHNEQSVRVVDFIERRTSKYYGLNLTYEVREGILKHNGDRSSIYENLNPKTPCSTLEGQIVKVVDTVAYICHDLQDGIISGLIEDTINKNSNFNKDISRIVELISNFIQEKKENIDLSKYSKTYFINTLIHKLIMNITNNSVSNLKSYKIKTSEDVKKLALEGKCIISFDTETKKFFKELRELIYKSVYGIHTIATMDVKAVKVVDDLFNIFINNPKLLPPEWLYRYTNLELNDAYKGFRNNEIHVVCDYISCMTDRFALEEHERVYNPRIKI